MTKDEALTRWTKLTALHAAGMIDGPELDEELAWLRVELDGGEG